MPLAFYVAYKSKFSYMNSKQVMNHAADNIRILAASMVEKAKSGHPGGAMGGADFIKVYYRPQIKTDNGEVVYGEPVKVKGICSMTLRTRNGKVVTVSSWTRATCHRCCTHSWLLSVNLH